MNEIVISIRVTNKFEVFINYSYLIINKESNECVLIDPSWEFDKIKDELLTHKTKLIAVLLTHSHFDHVNLAENFQKDFNCQVYMSKIEIDYYGYTCNNLNSFESSGLYSIGSIPIMVYLTPGHTAGSACFLIGKNLFTGDTLFVEGCGLCWGKGANPEQMYHSLNMLKEVIPHNFFVYPSHSYGEEPGVAFEYVMSNNIYLHFKDIERFIAFRMRGNQKGLFAFK